MQPATVKNGKQERRPLAEEHALQRRSLLLSIEQHIKNIQDSRQIGEVVIRLKVQRGGTIDRVRRVKYVAEFDYPEGEETNNVPA